jgi:hypothetical protein
MNEIKKAYEIYKKTLLKKLNLNLKKAIAISSKKPSKDNLVLENEILKETIDTFYSYTTILEAQNNQPSSAGRKRDQGNEIVLHKALEDCIRELNGIYPTLKQFQLHWDNPKLYKVNESKTHDSINGVGYEKLKKFVNQYKNNQVRRSKLLELGIVNFMAETKTRLSDMIKSNLKY